MALPVPTRPRPAGTRASEPRTAAQPGAWAPGHARPPEDSEPRPANPGSASPPFSFSLARELRRLLAPLPSVCSRCPGQKTGAVDKIPLSHYGYRETGTQGTVHVELGFERQLVLDSRVAHSKFTGERIPGRSLICSGRDQGLGYGV